MQKRSPQRGFTLIEVMIAVAIVAILAAVAIPQYTKYLYRAKQVEGVTLLGTIKSAQNTHYAHRDCYANVRNNPAVMPSSVRSTWDFALLNANLPCTNTADRSFEDISVRPGPIETWYQYNCRARVASLTMQTDDFSCTAIGDLDGDGNVYELLYCTDADADDTCIATAMGTISNFPWEPIRVSPAIW
jgi:prepilin-type N-terminal cleavage/methylation domain-containing protein